MFLKLEECQDFKGNELNDKIKNKIANKIMELINFRCK